MSQMNLFTFDAGSLGGRLGQVLAAEAENTGVRRASTAMVDKEEVPERKRRESHESARPGQHCYA